MYEALAADGGTEATSGPSLLPLRGRADERVVPV